MTWHAPTRSKAARAIHAAARDDRGAHPDRYELDPDAVVERVLSLGVPSTDALVGDWREPLERFCASAVEDGRLNAVGHKAMREQAAGKLALGAKVAARHDAGARPIRPPVVIVGGWRTGTTFLFRLLATDPRLRAPLPIELTRPWRVADLDAQGREALLRDLDGAPNPLAVLNPTLRSVHDHGPRLAEECVLALGADLRSWGLSSTVRLEQYSTWLATEDLTRSYAEYRRVLEILEQGDGRRWLLKAPAHTAELRALVDTFPGATIVHLHRDIVETISSGASLFAVFRSTYSDDVDPVDVGRFLTEQTETWMRRAVAYRTDPHSRGATFVDLAYPALVADPATAINRICAAASLEPVADPQRLIESYHRASPRHEHGRHRYTPEDFGLDPGGLRERFAFLDGAVPST